MGIVNIKTGKEMTRRDFISGGIAAASMVGLAGSANASVRRGLGARLAANFAGGGGGGPYDAEVEWLENLSTSSTRMSTGIKVAQTMTLEWTSTLTSPIGAYAQLGPRSGTAGDPSTMLRYGGNVNAVQSYFAYSGWASQTGIIVRGRTSVVQNKTQAVVNDSLIIASSSNRAVDLNELYIWGDSASLETTRTIRFECLKIKDGDNALVRDFIPVVKDGVGYMFDRCGSICSLTGTSLYPNETGDAFSIGPAK